MLREILINNLVCRRFSVEKTKILLLLAKKINTFFLSHEQVMENMEDALGALDEKMSMTMSRIEQRLNTLENMVR